METEIQEMQLQAKECQRIPRAPGSRGDTGSGFPLEPLDRTN